MKFMKINTLIAVIAVTLAAPSAFAQKHDSTGSHSGMNHGAVSHSTGHQGMDHSGMEHGDQVMGIGVIHRVSKLNKMVNLTHEPIPALNWPEMTMDLPVADSVDLTSLQTGQKVKFHLKLGADKKYVITSIMKEE